jgi:hypothetical protein
MVPQIKKSQNTFPLGISKKKTVEQVRLDNSIVERKFFEVK